MPNLETPHSNMGISGNTAKKDLWLNSCADGLLTALEGRGGGRNRLLKISGILKMDQRKESLFSIELGALVDKASVKCTICWGFAKTVSKVSVSSYHQTSKRNNKERFSSQQRTISI